MQPLLKLKHKLISLKEPLKEGSSSRLIVFDLDHTLISVASNYVYMKSLYERRLVSIKTLLKALLIGAQAHVLRSKVLIEAVALLCPVKLSIPLVSRRVYLLLRQVKLPVR